MESPSNPFHFRGWGGGELMAREPIYILYSGSGRDRIKAASHLPIGPASPPAWISFKKN